MGRRLLSFPILRTRSARKKLVGGSVIVLLGAPLVGCEDDPPVRSTDLAARSQAGPTSGRAASPAGSSTANAVAAREEGVRRAAKELAELEIEAGIEPEHDLPAPGGDLAHDLEAFTTLDACVHTHRVTDPVLADAVDTLGYDTLVRDACRTLQALKSKDAKLCSPISASPLRQRCETQVAVLAGEPALCPFAGGSGAQAREPVCLARASRDERLCAAALPTDRASCKALVRGRPGDCEGDAACIRQVERYRALLEKPQNHPPFPAHLHVEAAGEGGKLEKYDAKFDLDDLAAAGAVARPIADKVRLTVGSQRSNLWPSWDSSRATPSLFLAVSVPAKMPARSAQETEAKAGLPIGPSDLSFDLLIPHVGLLGGTLASDRRVEYDAVSAAPGSPVHLTLTTKVSDAGRMFRVRIELETFVRDGVEPRPGLKAR